MRLSPSCDQKYQLSEPGIGLISFTHNPLGSSPPSQRKSMRMTDRAITRWLTSTAAARRDDSMAAGSTAGSSRGAVAMPPPPVRYFSA